jgi:hypothetical protein
MAIITKWERRPEGRRRRQTETVCEWSYFDDAQGERLLQLSTVGTDARKNVGARSQSLQVDRKGAEQLVSMLKEAFPGIC